PSTLGRHSAPVTLEGEEGGDDLGRAVERDPGERAAVAGLSFRGLRLCDLRDSSNRIVDCVHEQPVRVGLLLIAPREQSAERYAAKCAEACDEPGGDGAHD